MFGIVPRTEAGAVLFAPMLPIIVVDVVPPDAPAASVSALMSACTVGLPQGRCVPQRPKDVAQKDVAAVATVTWSEGRETASIELGRLRPTGPVWVTDSLHFAPTDPDIERWRAAGFSVATLAGKVGATPPEPREEPQPTETPPVKREPKSPPAPATSPSPRIAPTRDPWLSVSAGPALGRGLDDGSARVGGWLAASVRPVELPLFAVASFAASSRVSSDSLDVLWLTPRAGVGGAWTHSASGVELRGSVHAVFENAMVTAHAGGGTDTDTKWMLGLGLEADLVWPAHARWAGLVGFHFTRFDGGTGLVVDGTAAPSLPAWTYLLTLGVEFHAF